MDFIFFFNNYLNLLLNFSDEIIIILLTYNFIKVLIFSSIFELIWPTQYCNKKNNFNNIIRFRSFNEYFLKFKNKNIYKFVLFNFFLK